MAHWLSHFSLKKAVAEEVEEEEEEEEEDGAR